MDTLSSENIFTLIIGIMFFIACPIRFAYITDLDRRLKNQVQESDPLTYL